MPNLLDKPLKAVETKVDSVDRSITVTGGNLAGCAHETALRSVLAALPIDLQSAEEIERVFATFHSMNPRDEVEGMLIAQMTINQLLIKQLLPTLVHRNQSENGMQLGTSRVNKLMTLYCRQVDTLKRYRDGGKQTIQIQHVNVNDGGQAVVGNVLGGSDG